MAYTKAVEQKGRIKEIFSSVSNDDYPVCRGAQKLGMDVDTFMEKMSEAGYKVPPETAQNR